ncbi:uncharacterized protein LOC131940553 [Physella acuta]|uniref:uncharacterized protein LOC131940553 n=1 Tax=Physella acuta TaxID=109671 RepID=UPI0027DAF5F4|nr:uncharacterized protein LOC131940553 [Physella acuta]XP_059155221.1 uncharacterized protein LOC131940553 [Physella acuta]
MTTRSLMALTYANHHTNTVLNKQAKNRPLGDIEQRLNYTPAQPVLSCRTVAIDLNGTRTYRPKSSEDILEEQQKLIRTIYSRQESTSPTSARNISSTRAKIRPSSEPGHPRINIEVKGRPVTARTYGLSPRVNKTPVLSPRRSKSVRLSKVRPATDCFMVIHTDQDILSHSKSNKVLTNQLRSYWSSETNHLAQGVFMRGQRRPDDVPPTLEAWLTFGGAGRGDGVIDAFASFKGAEEYYNIEGTVGNTVAQQLQKGGAVRIGINGDLLSQDLKVRKRSQEQKKESSVEDDFQDFMLNTLDQQRENMDNMQTGKSGTTTPSGQENKTSAAPIPLSWDDQCSKPDVKIIRPVTSAGQVLVPVMSETIPVKFEKLINRNLKPQQTTNQTEGYRIKQRSNRASSAKVKVVYIDPLTKEDDEKLNGMSVEEIVNFKLDKLNIDNTAISIHQSLHGHNSSVPTVSDPSTGHDPHMGQPPSPRTIKNGTKTSRPNSNTSQKSERTASPRMKTVPVHPSKLQPPPTNLSIVANGAHQPANEPTKPTTEPTKPTKPHGKLSPSKPLHRTGLGVAMKTPPTLVDAEFITITSQIRAAPGSLTSPAPGSLTSPRSQASSDGSYNFSPGSNTPRGVNDPEQEKIPSNIPLINVNNKEPTALQNDRSSNHGNSAQQAGEAAVNGEEVHDSKEPQQKGAEPVVTMLAINIPTADDLSDRESPAHLED